MIWHVTLGTNNTIKEKNMTYEINNVVVEESHGFLPAKFVIPSTESPGRFIILPLSMDLLVYDFQCLKLSREHLATSGNVWSPGELDFPPENLTLRKLLAILGGVEVDMSNGKRVEYAVMNPEKTEEIGCVFIDPSPKVGYDAMVTMFVRGDLYKTTDLDVELFGFVRQWMPEAYPFPADRFAYPGRAISWDKWSTLPDV